MEPSINQFEPGETTGYVKLYMNITSNNNGTTYNSAEMNIDDILSDVADKIIQYNSDYSTNTKEDVYAEWGFNLLYLARFLNFTRKKWLNGFFRGGTIFILPIN